MFASDEEHVGKPAAASVGEKLPVLRRERGGQVPLKLPYRDFSDRAFGFKLKFCQARPNPFVHMTSG